MVFGASISIAERGHLVANWYGKSELGVGNGSVWNMAQMRLARGGRWGVGASEVEAPVGGGQGIVHVDGGFAVKLVNLNGRMALVDVDGTCGASGWGISFGGYEERS